MLRKIMDTIETYINSILPQVDDKLLFFRIIGFSLLLLLLLLLIYSIISCNLDMLIKILVPLGVLTSAFLASYSVLKNIEFTNSTNIDKKESIKKRNNSILIALLNGLQDEIITQIKYFSFDSIGQTINEYSEIQINKRFYYIADRLVDIELNHYNSADIIERFMKLRIDILEAMHAFNVYKKNNNQGNPKLFIELLKERKETVSRLIKDLK